MKTTKFDSFIMSSYFEDDELCDTLIDFFEKNPSKISKNSIEENGVQESQRLGAELSFVDLPEEMMNSYLRELTTLLRHYMIHYESCDQAVTPWRVLEAPKIQRYGVNEGGYEWFIDRASPEFPFTNRHLTFITFLNDVEIGGELDFFYQDFKVRPKKGLTLFWPSGWTHAHRALSPLSNSKYVVTGYYSLNCRN
jgi:hypothetical protein